MHFGVLGTLIAADDDRVVTPRGTMRRRLLAVLLSRPNQVLSTELLIDALWNGAPPPTAGKTLQSHVVRLRDAVDADRRILQTRPPGYLLAVDPHDLDVLQFDQLVSRARNARNAGVPDSAAAMLADALALWRGPAYEDLRDCDYLARAGAQLDARRLSTLEERVEADLACGRGAELVTELAAAVAAHPFREAMWRQYAIALYRSDRQADGLAALRRVRTSLRAELGVDPGPELRAVEQAILQHDPALDPAPREQQAAAALPAALTGDRWPLVGRDAELAWLGQAWSDAARSRGGLVVVRGPAGIGRSRLLAELARSVSARGVPVRFASGREDGDPLANALRRGGVPLRGNEPPAEVVRALRRTADLAPMLVVLDDIDRCARTALAGLEQAVREARDLPVLIAVSYSAAAATAPLEAVIADLDPSGERTWTLGPLSRDAVTQVVHQTVPAADRDQVEEVVASAGGQPRQLRVAITGTVEQVAERRLGEAARDAQGVRRGLGPARRALTSGVVDLRAAREERAAAHRTEPPAQVVCPYKGLARYDVADAAFFVGREQLTAQLVGRLVEDDLVAIVGASGSGKSSLARAGLLASLADGVLPGSDGWHQLCLVPGHDPPAALERALDGDEGVTPAVILVDQFEEVFTACLDRERRDRFVAELLALRGGGTRLVLTMRAEFFGHCAAYPELAAALSDSAVLVGPMTRAELALVVQTPARRAGLVLAPGVTDLILGEVAEQPGALPLLSTALLRTWEHRRGHDLTVGSYREGGGIERAVERLGESAYERMEPAAQVAGRRLLLRLADPGPTGDSYVRRRALRAELVPTGDQAGEQALGVLVERRLVSVDDQLVEVTHEALFSAWPRLRGWLDEDAAGRRLVRQVSAAAADWVARGQDTAELYRGARLQAGLDWAALHGDDLTETERQFLAAGADEAEREQRAAAARLAQERRSRRRLSRLLVALAAVLVIALASAGVAASSRSRAERAAAAADDAARIAEARRLGALGVVTPDLDRALLLAVQAVRIDDSAETRGDLLATLLRSPAASKIVRPPGGHRVLALDMAPDSRRLVMGDNAGNLSLIDTRTGTVDQLRVATGGAETIPVAEFSSDGRTIATMHTRLDTSWVELWDVPARSVERVPGFEVWGLGWSPAGRRLAIVKYQADAIVIDADRPAAAPLRLVGSAGQTIGPVRWLDPATVVISPDDGPLGLWDVNTGRPERRSAIAGRESVLATPADRRRLALSDGAEIRLHDARTLRRQAVLTGHRAKVLDLAYSPDGRWLASVSDDREVILWDVRSRTLHERLPGHAGRVVRADWAPDGQTLWTASLDGTVMAWDVPGRRRLAEPIAAGGAAVVDWFSIDPAARWALAGYSDGRAQVWDVAAGRPLGGPIKASEQGFPSVALSPDGTRFVLCGADGKARVYRTTDRKLLGTVPGLSGQRVSDAAFSPDGRTLGVSVADGRFHLVDVATLKPITSAIRPAARVWAATWSPDGQILLLSTDPSPDVEVWSVSEERRIAMFRPDDTITFTAAFAPGGQTVATGGVDGRVRFWEAGTWRPIGEPVLMGAGYVYSISFSADGRLMATGSSDGTVRLMDAATRRPLGPPMPGPNEKSAYVIRIVGDRVVAGFGDGAIISYDIDPASWVRRACAIAGRQLTEAEWRDVLPGRPYARTC